MTTNFTRKLTIAGLAIAGVATSLAAVSAPSSALADTSSRPGTGVLKSQDSGGTFTLTFQGQTTSPAKEGRTNEYTWSVQAGERAAAGDGVVSDSFGFGVEREMRTEDGDASGAKGGNVEFEWKVEEAESFPIDIDDLALDGETVEGGAIPVYWHVIRSR